MALPIRTPFPTIISAKFIKMVVKMLGAEQKTNKLYFEDVPANHFAKDAISTAFELGIINGVDEKHFSPDAPLSYEQAVKIIVTALGYKLKAESKGGYPFGYMLIAKQLEEQADGVDYFCRKPMALPKDNKYTRLHEGEELFKAYMSAVGKAKRKLPPPLEAFTEIVSKKIVSVGTRISYIYKSMRKRSKKKLSEFFETAESRSELVATFLAVLELVKAKRIPVNEENGDMRVDFIGDPDENFEMDGDSFEY
mgnify:CR=1 FL=1